MTLINKGAHLVLGFWVGWGINDPRYRVGLIILACFFGLYQKLETDQIADGGWHEVKEFMIGMGIALLSQRVRNHDAQTGDLSRRLNTIARWYLARPGFGKSPQLGTEIEG